jgi:hypothetical protein
VRVREADPRQRILKTPRWVDRVAAGVLACDPRWLKPEELTQVSQRAEAIRTVRWRRSTTRPELDVMCVADIRVRGSTQVGYALWLAGRCVHRWPLKPGRAEILRFVRETREHQKEAERQRARQEAQKRFLAPSPDVPDTLGWRGWRWDGSTLVSPQQRTPWHEPSLHAERWSDSAAVRAQAGIHARLVPTDWRRADPRLTEIGHCDVHGIVERFGHYVLGTEGWRAEWVVIRELMAPDAETALALMQVYPEVRVHVRELEETHENR